MEVLKDLQASVLEACEVSFRNAHKELESQLTAQDARAEEAKRNASIAHDAQQAAEQRVQELQREVSALRDELNTYNVDPKELELPAEISNLEREFAPKNIWRTDLLDTDQLREILEDKYTTLYTDLQAFTRSWNDLKSKLLQHKKKLQLWEKQLKKDSFTLTLEKSPVTFQRVLNKESTTLRNPQQLQTPITRATSSVPENTQGQEPVANNGMPTPSVQSRAGANPRVKIEESSQEMSAPNQALTTATQATSASGDTLSSESSSDVLYPLPNIQTKKRKRVIPSDGGEPQRGAAERPVLVKAETLSSSPMHHAAPLGSGPHFPSTQDLDDIPATVPTPTKRHAHREVHWEDEDVDSGPRTQNAIPDRETQIHNVLQPVDGNARTIHSSRKELGHGKPRPLSNHALLMAEDGDYFDTQDRSRKRHAQSFAAVQKQSGAEGRVTRDRLQGLLEGSLPPKSPLRSPGQVLGNAGSRPAKPASPRPLPERQAVDQPSQTCPEVRPEEEPYRSLPLHRLNLDHFKINPARNQGLDYAYDTVVRKKDDRKCMSGCTRPGCCGDRFRAMARMGVQGTMTSAEQKEDEQRLLEEFLGENRHQLDDMSDEERKTVLVEARARDLANQYGRHRHTHQRARSPPGFWRTEMPSTQEIEADREAARKMEREKVEERYREAMRPGGLWTFADE